MKHVEPTVYLIARPAIDWDELRSYLKAVDGVAWSDRAHTGVDEVDGERLIEAGGRLCYRSWKPGLNPNVTKVREDSAAYLQNILKSKHGSVLEHANFTFIFHNVSRVFTHELVRHRAGTAVSQESMRYVRLTDIPFWIPEWAQDDPELVAVLVRSVEASESMQKALARHFKLDEADVRFDDKKAKTSFMRRFAPDGIATSVMWTANVRTLRHLIELRTAPHAEEEIRLVFDLVAHIMVAEMPALFGDYEQQPDGSWTTEWSKV